MNMRMPLQGLSPRVQNTEKADLRTEMLLVGSHFQQRGGTGFKQEAKQDLLVLPDERDELIAGD